MATDTEIMWYDEYSTIPSSGNDECVLEYTAMDGTKHTETFRARKITGAGNKE